MIIINKKVLAIMNRKLVKIKIVKYSNKNKFQQL